MTKSNDLWKSIVDEVEVIVNRHLETVTVHILQHEERENEEDRGRDRIENVVEIRDLKKLGITSIITITVNMRLFNQGRTASSTLILR